MNAGVGAGTVLEGRYELCEPLGGGGMGQVWRGTDLVDGRPVAVKIIGSALLEADGDRGDVLRRFYREAAATRQLTHPHIVAVHHLGEHGGMPFLVLELLHGRDLRSVLGGFPHGLPVGEVLAYGAQVAAGLAVAHAAGIVHRDIKPANLMLVDDGVVKICDFGIARVADASTGLTRGVIGTVAYMPPEQLQGGEVDARSDLYALGATLFHLLTGRPLFTGNAEAVAVQHLTAPPPGVRRFRPDVPSDVELFLQSLLAKQPDERPPNATVVEDRLSALSDGSADPDPLLAIAEHRVRSLDGSRARLAAVVELAPRLARRDPRRALRLLSDFMPVEPGAWRYSGIGLNASGGDLAEVTRALAECAPAVAEEFAESLRDPDAYLLVRAEIALVLIRQSPRRAQQLLAELERLAEDDLRRGALRAAVALILAEHSPAEAERLARTIKPDDRDPHWEHPVFRRMVPVIAAHDAAAAERLARTLRDRDAALADVARVVAERDLDEGERLAMSVKDPFLKLTALIEHARAAAPRDSGHAEHTLREAADFCRYLAAYTTGAAALKSTWDVLPAHMREIAVLLGDLDAAAATDLLDEGARNAEALAYPALRDRALGEFVEAFLELRDIGSAIRFANTIKAGDARYVARQRLTRYMADRPAELTEEESKILYRILNETPAAALAGAACALPWLAAAVTLACFRWFSPWEVLTVLSGTIALAGTVVLKLRHREVPFLVETVVGAALAAIVLMLAADAFYIWWAVAGDADWFLLGGALLELAAMAPIVVAGRLGLFDRTPLPAPPRRNEPRAAAL
ncbi:protein kinase [Spirillospora sp. NPDC052242]